ncbi:hypothetical protein [Bosea minatitlanensis]|uniref:Lipoprotein n=1 Tax=Bosea minatitlanensis TaxID=128782 RepID=A0ABW0F4V4_9HYPH|nr:hypothetical protein [Bosea minatitlanensis]MCT4493847.1 hypothetical protein [Bosea minatitlanensis]
MIDLRACGLVLLAALACSGCRDAEAQGEDFLPLIQAYFDKEPVCVAVRRIPIDTNDAWVQGNLRTLVDQGLLAEETPPADVSAAIGPSRRFTLTQAGAGFYRAEGLPEIPRQPVLCFARREITGIVATEIEPPRGEEDFALEPRKARITFDQRVVEIAPWAEAKAVQAAFSAIPTQLRTSGEKGKIEFVWKDGTWLAQPSYAFPLRDARQLGR